jgi:hypothetical protein
MQISRRCDQRDHGERVKMAACLSADHEPIQRMSVQANLSRPNHSWSSPAPGTLNVDDQQLTLTYESGEEYRLVLGMIAETGPGVIKYYQPLSQPIVAALNQLMVEANQQRIEIGSIVYSFAKMIKGLTSGDMSGVLEELKQQQNG